MKEEIRYMQLQEVPEKKKIKEKRFGVIEKQDRFTFFN